MGYLGTLAVGKFRHTKIGFLNFSVVCLMHELTCLATAVPLQNWVEWTFWQLSADCNGTWLLHNELVTELKKTVSIALASYAENAATQSQKNHGSVVALLSWKFLQKSGKFLQQRIQLLKTLRLARKLSGWFVNYPDNPETIQRIWKLSGQSRDCPEKPETVRMI